MQSFIFLSALSFIWFLRNYRHGLHTKKRKIDEFPEVKKQLPYQPSQLIALPSDVHNEDQQDLQRSMASLLVQGGANVCKSRIINFERTDFLPQGWT